MQVKHGLLSGALALALVVPAVPDIADAKRKCHPAYKGKCLKRKASDYDCRGGSGNGPYDTGRVRVVGPDVFDLDRDGDGVGCDE